MLDLGSEVQWFNTQWGNILLLEFFFHEIKPLMPMHFEKTLLHELQSSEFQEASVNRMSEYSEVL